MTKLLANLLFPVPLCIEILIAGILLLWFTKMQKLGKSLLTAGVLLLLLFSSHSFSNYLIGSLEEQYITLTDVDILENHPDIMYVVVLGGAVAYDKNLSIINQFYSSSLVRILEGVRLYHTLPEVKLIVSGGSYDRVTSAELMASLSEKYKVDSKDILIEKDSLNTYEEAVYLKDIIGNSVFLLVTSAIHMPRAMALFKKQNMNPVAFSTDHSIKKERSFRVKTLLPTSGNLSKTTSAFYEYLGLAKEKLSGHI